jgi:hypothetical protein
MPAGSTKKQFFRPHRHQDHETGISVLITLYLTINFCGYIHLLFIQPYPNTNMNINATYRKYSCNWPYILDKLTQHYHFTLPYHTNLPPLPSNNKALLFIESRFYPHMLTILRKAFHHFPDWGLICYIEQSVAEQYQTLFNTHFSNIHWIIFNDPNYNITSYNNDLTNPQFWQQLPAQHLFIIQYDTWIIGKQNINDFLQYDYIGAPWFYSIYTQEEMNIEYPQWFIPDTQRCGGNGGLSLRHRDAMIDICQQPNLSRYMPNGDIMPEDIFFSTNCYKFGKRLPTLETCIQFACEQYYQPNVVGIHRPFSLIPWSNLFNDIFPELTPLTEECYTQVHQTIPIWYPYAGPNMPPVTDTQWTIVNQTVFQQLCPDEYINHHEMLTEYEHPLGITYILRILLLYQFGGWILNPIYTITSQILEQIPNLSTEPFVLCAIHTNVPIAIYTPPKHPIFHQLIEQTKQRVVQRLHFDIMENVGDPWIMSFLKQHNISSATIQHEYIHTQSANFHQLQSYTMDSISYLHTMIWRERQHEIFEWIPIQNLEVLRNAKFQFNLFGYNITRLCSIIDMKVGWIHMTTSRATLYQTFALVDSEKYTNELYKNNRYDILTIKPYLLSIYHVYLQEYTIEQPLPTNMAMVSSNQTGRRVGFGFYLHDDNLFMMEIDPLLNLDHERMVLWSEMNLIQSNKILILCVSRK